MNISEYILHFFFNFRHIFTSSMFSKTFCFIAWNSNYFLLLQTLRYTFLNIFYKWNLILCEMYITLTISLSLSLQHNGKKKKNQALAKLEFLCYTRFSSEIGQFLSLEQTGQESRKYSREQLLEACQMNRNFRDHTMLRYWILARKKGGSQGKRHFFALIWQFRKVLYLQYELCLELRSIVGIMAKLKLIQLSEAKFKTW